MKAQNQFGFIAKKIISLETAIMHCHSNSLFKFPTSIIQTLHVDEVGCVWISVKRPMQFVNQFDQSFHVGLNYYKKGVPYYLNILGLARIVNDPEEFNHLPAAIKDTASENLIVSIRMQEASYYETAPKKEQPVLQRWKQSIYDLLNGNHNSYQFLNQDETHYA